MKAAIGFAVAACLIPAAGVHGQATADVPPWYELDQVEPRSGVLDSYAASTSWVDYMRAQGTTDRCPGESMRRCVHAPESFWRLRGRPSGGFGIAHVDPFPLVPTGAPPPPEPQVPGLDHYIAWVPSDRADGGAALVSELRRQASIAQRTFSDGECLQGVCRGYVFGYVGDETIIHGKPITSAETRDAFLQDTIIAACRFEQQGDWISHIPSRCSEAAVFRDGQWWVQALVGFRGPPRPPTPAPAPPSAPTPMFRIEQGVSYISPESLRQMIRRVLEESPFALEVRIRPALVRGTAPPRLSRVIKNRREEVVITVETEQEGRSFVIHRSIELYLSRIATSDQKYWKKPSRQERATYEKALRERLRQKIDGMCRMRTWMDDFTMVCYEAPGR